MDELSSPSPQAEARADRVSAVEPSDRLPRSARRAARSGFFRALVFLLALTALCWVLLVLHPETGALTVKSQTSIFDIGSRVDRLVTNAASDALDGIAVIRKIYSIPETDLVAPLPDPTRYGVTNDPAEVQAVLDEAAVLLDGQEMIWNPDIQRVKGSDIQYYRDDSILAVAWKEPIEYTAVSFCEIRIADGSQLRRCLAGNTYGSSLHLLATDMAKSVNAVIAINGDYYDYRRLGLTAYQRQLYRVNPDRVDSAFFTASGDILFSHPDELADEAEAAQFLADNDVVFAISFGPILVEDGKMTQLGNYYPVGEITDHYSRSVIAQVDELHYLLMTVNIEPGLTHAATLYQAQRFIYDKGVQSAYNLDGGQTAVLVFGGELFNRVDWGAQRNMSDIIYFATAIPEEEWQT